MTEFGSNPGDWLALVALLTAVGALAVLQVQRRRLAALLAVTDARLKHLERDVRALCSTGARVGERVVEIEQDLRRALQWQSQLELRSPQTEPLRHAINLVERGASADDLVAACGLSRGEAELMA
ncbi:MAG: DUF2802 domain-containing protein, partial [Planctomycetes bacterium]|nr:DUF2802 domain-containing protein [Planctomycetota bacterium]